MHFPTATIAFVASALMLALAPKAALAGITAFSGNTCDGDVGLNVPCDGSCHAFDNRHSFRVDGGSGAHCVTLYENAGCPSGGPGFFSQNQDGGCQNVNSGTNIQSFRCAATNGCLE